MGRHRSAQRRDGLGRAARLVNLRGVALAGARAAAEASIGLRMTEPGRLEGQTADDAQVLLGR